MDFGFGGILLIMIGGVVLFKWLHKNFKFILVVIVLLIKGIPNRIKRKRKNL